MNKLLLTTAFAVTTTITAQANWFTELFESTEARAIREHRSKYAVCPDPYPCAWHQKLQADWQAALARSPQGSYDYDNEVQDYIDEQEALEQEALDRQADSYRY